MLLVGVGGWLTLAPDAPADVGVVPAASMSVGTDAGDETPVPAPLVPAPTRLTLPGSPDAEIVPVRVGRGGQLNIPADPDVLGWWRSGARPGAGQGSVVLVGHVDSAELGVGLFARLAETRRGDRVSVTDSAGDVHAYRVEARRSYPKASLPAAEVFSQTVGERLVLLTCTGDYDRAAGGYPENLVVYAVPAD